LDRALAKNPDERYASGAELVAALRHVTETQALPTMMIPDAVDPDAKTIIMLPRSAVSAAAATELVTRAVSAKIPAPKTQTVARPQPAATVAVAARPARPVRPATTVVEA